MSRPAHEFPVFAYGSNMHFDDLQAWARRHQREVSIERVSGGVLSDHCLVFNYWSASRRGGAANVRPTNSVPVRHQSPASFGVPGLLLWVGEQALSALDRKEGHPVLYRRHLMPVLYRMPSGRDGGGSIEGAAQAPRQLSDEPRPRSGSDLAWVYVVEGHAQEQDFVAPTAYYRGLLQSAAMHFDFAHGYQEWLATVPTSDE